jgi:hypothetical protein
MHATDKKERSMRGQALIAAVFAVATFAAAPQASAQQYRSYHDEHVSRQQQCVQERRSGAISGAILGGLAGAILGSQAASRGHRTDGSVLGGVVGAAAGAAIGNSASNRNCQQQVQGAYDPYNGAPQSQYGQQPYYDDGSGLAGGPYRESGYANDGWRSSQNNSQNSNNQNCRWGEAITRDPDGYEIRESVYMCRGRDGQWRAS